MLKNTPAPAPLSVPAEPLPERAIPPENHVNSYFFNHMV
jgi:hypothetical protein